MIELAGAFVDLIDTPAWATLLVFLRVSAAMMLLPAFGSQSVPVRFRLAVAVAFTAIVAPLVQPSTDPATLGTLVRHLGSETVVGLSMGFAIRLFFWALQVAGTMAAQATSLAQLLGAEAIDPQPAMAQILLIAGLALAAIAGLHVRIAEAFVMSYQAFPAGTFPGPPDLAEWSIAGVSRMFELAFTFSAPFVIASVIYNFTLGVINRAMPQLMVAFVGAPAITAAGLILLLLAAPVVLQVWLDLLNARLATPFGAIR